MRKYRSYTVEFKRTVVEEIDSGKKTQAAAAREYEIASSLIDRWREQIYAGTIKGVPTAKEKQLERELEKYKSKVGELTLFIDMLKKTQKDSLFMKKLRGSVITQKDLDQSKDGAK